jgi:hypothetical protein
MIQLSDEDILSRLRNTEDNTVERKVASDYRDCLKTAVGFSNSLPVGDPGIIFVGVDNKGAPQGGQNFDSLQINVSKELNKIYPQISPQMLVRKDESGKEFLAVIVRGSENRPHFAGPSYIREGSQTLPASKQQFERLIAERNSKLRYILQWKGKQITYRYLEPNLKPTRAGILTDCNQHFVVIDGTRAIPLECVLVSHDGTDKRLKLDFKYAG